MAKRTTTNGTRSKPERLTPTSGKTWRSLREVGHAVELPSGNIASIRNVNVDFFIRLGRIPDFLTTAVVETLQQGSANLPDVEEMEQAGAFIDFLNALCEAAFVNPKVINCPVDAIPDLADNEITVWDVDMEDKVAIMSLFNMPARFLESFRPSERLHVESVDDSEDDGQASVGGTASEPVVSEVDRVAGE